MDPSLKVTSSDVKLQAISVGPEEISVGAESMMDQLFKKILSNDNIKMGQVLDKFTIGNDNYKIVKVGNDTKNPSINIYKNDKLIYERQPKWTGINVDPPGVREVAHFYITKYKEKSEDLKNMVDFSSTGQGVLFRTKVGG